MGLAFGVPMRSSGSTSIAQVSKLMDVESMQTCRETVHLGRNLNLLSLDLDELAPAADTAASVRVQNADCVVSFNFACLDHSCYSSVFHSPGLEEGVGDALGFRSLVVSSERLGAISVASATV